MAFFLAAIFATEFIVAASEINLAASFEWNWDMTNTCGPRPQGPKYPEPPLNGTRSYKVPVECDIIPDNNYIFDYKCSAPCQMEPERIVNVACKCFFKVGPIKQVVPCHWEYVDSEACPEVPIEQQVDYECDPRNGTCAAYPQEIPIEEEVIEEEQEVDELQTLEELATLENDTISDVEVSVTNKPTKDPSNVPNWSNQHNMANVDRPYWQMPMPQMPMPQMPMQQMPMPQMSLPQMAGMGVPMGNMAPMGMPMGMNGMGSPIIISPVMTQNVGDVSATSHDAADHQPVVSAPRPGPRPVSQETETVTSPHQEAERNGADIKAAEDGFKRERSEFNRERENMKVLYENALKSKEQARLDTVRQLTDLHELIKTKLFSTEMDHTQDDEVQNAKNSQESSLWQANVRRSRRTDN